MKTFRLTACVAVLVLGFAVLASADLIDFMKRVDAKAKEDISRFHVKLSAQFGLPVPRIDEIAKRVPTPADAFMVLHLGQISNKPPETVLRTYETSRDKGWGAIAKELGIKPGSPEFHALKSGNIRFDGEHDDRAPRNEGKKQTKAKKGSKKTGGNKQDKN